jgi:hypothetical protein
MGSQHPHRRLDEDGQDGHVHDDEAAPLAQPTQRRTTKNEPAMS